MTEGEERLDWPHATGKHPRHPYASMIWVRFIGSPRCLAAQRNLSPLSGLPLVESVRICIVFRIVNGTDQKEAGGPAAKPGAG